MAGLDEDADTLLAGLDEEADTLLALVLMVLDFLGAITRIYKGGTKAQQKTNIQNCVGDT